MKNSLNFFQFFMTDESEASYLLSMYSMPYQSTYPSYVRVLAPSTFMICPVIPSALSEVKKVIARPTSSGKTSLFNGLRCLALPLNSHYSLLLYPEYLYMFDSTTLGATALTLIPNGAYSRAADLVSISNPAFDMQ